MHFITVFNKNHQDVQLFFIKHYNRTKHGLSIMHTEVSRNQQRFKFPTVVLLNPINFTKRGRLAAAGLFVVNNAPTRRLPMEVFLLFFFLVISYSNPYPLLTLLHITTIKNL